MAAALHDGVQDDRARGLGEPGQLGHRLLRASAADAAGPDADQHDPLELQLAVLDLGDVGELGGQAGDPAQRGAVGQVALALGVLLQVELDRLVLQQDGRAAVTVVVGGLNSHS